MSESPGPFEWIEHDLGVETWKAESASPGVDPANGVDCSISFVRGTDGTLYHEGKDYRVKDGFIEALPGGRLWDKHRHKTVSVGYTVVVDEAAEMASRTPFDRDACAAAFEALRPRNAPVKVQRPPLHNPQPWNPPTAKRRKR